MDLDGFKGINDTFGHQLGNQVLQQTAVRLLDCVRKEDTVCRVGGDEFTILFDQIEDGRILTGIAQKLLSHLQNRLLLGGHEVLVQASRGCGRAGHVDAQQLGWAGGV